MCKNEEKGKYISSLVRSEKQCDPRHHLNDMGVENDQRKTKKVNYHLVIPFNLFDKT